MTAGVGANAGTKFYIGAAGSPPTSPDLWIEVGDISNLGDIMDQFTQITVESLGSGYSYAIKGTENFPNLDLTLNRNDSDVGQIAMKAASAATRGTLYPFKIVDYDAGTAIWQGEVFGFGRSYGSVNVLRTVKTSVSIRPSTITMT
jgi:hypothetical protein